MLKISSLLSFAALSALATPQNIGYRLLGQFETEGPAFVNIDSFDKTNDFLMISSFGVFSNGKVSIVPEISSFIKSKNISAISPTMVASGFQWPNDARSVPSAVFNDGIPSFVVPDGFLVPFHNNGGVYVFQVDPTDITKKTNQVTLTETHKGFFYHMGKWVDINNDGRLDYITARSNAKAGQGELVWLEHPEGGLSQAPWKEHVITTGPDVNIEIGEQSNYEDSYIVFAAEFFTKSLNVYQIKKGTGELMQKRVIDDTIDQAYSVSVVDLTNDGYGQLIVNNHEKKEAQAAVFSYNIPADLFKGKFERTTLATGFKNEFSLLVPNMSPGFVYPVFPN